MIFKGWRARASESVGFPITLSETFRLTLVYRELSDIKILISTNVLYIVCAPSIHCKNDEVNDGREGGSKGNRVEYYFHFALLCPELETSSLPPFVAILPWHNYSSLQPRAAFSPPPNVFATSWPRFYNRPLF